MLQEALCAFIGRVPRDKVPTDVQHAIRNWTKPKDQRTSAPSTIRSFFIEKRRNEGKGKGKRKGASPQQAKPKEEPTQAPPQQGTKNVQGLEYVKVM